jgi:hypothetical protein
MILDTHSLKVTLKENTFVRLGPEFTRAKPK